MNAGDVVALVAGGGLGAGARYVVDTAVMRGRTEAFPLGILVVNVSGSFLLGVLTGLAPLIGPVWLAIAGVGVLGGFTTFSTVSVDSVRLARGGRRDWAWANLIGTLVACVAAAALGYMLGGLLPR
jgi:CrcB protein